TEKARFGSSPRAKEPLPPGPTRRAARSAPDGTPRDLTHSQSRCRSHLGACQSHSRLFHGAIAAHPVRGCTVEVGAARAWLSTFHQAVGTTITASGFFHCLLEHPRFRTYDDARIDAPGLPALSSLRAREHPTPRVDGYPLTPVRSAFAGVTYRHLGDRAGTAWDRDGYFVRLSRDGWLTVPEDGLPVRVD